MKKLAALAATATLTFAACGGGSSPAAPVATQAAAAPAATQAAQAPAATQAAPAPAATQAAAVPAAAGPARKLALSATNDSLGLTKLEVKPGEKIEFVVTNTGEEKHNLVGVGDGVSIVAPDFDAGSTISWIWTAPTKPMTFKFVCSFHPKIPPIEVTVK